MVLVGWSRSWPERPTRRRESLAERWARLTRRPAGRAGRNRDLILVGSLAAGLVVAALSGWAAGHRRRATPRPRTALPAGPAQGARRRAAGGAGPVGASFGGLDDHRTFGHRRHPDLPPHRAADPGRRGRSAGGPAQQPLGHHRRPAQLRRRPGLARRRRGGRGVDLGRPTRSERRLADPVRAGGFDPRSAEGSPAIETERAKPYVVVRQVTIISLVTLGGMFVAVARLLRRVRDPARPGDLVGAGAALPLLADLVAAQGAADPARADPGGSPSMTRPVDHGHRSADRGWAGGAHRRARADALRACSPLCNACSASPGPGSSTVELTESGRSSERLGAWLFRHSPIPLTERQRQSLRLQGKSVAEFYADKIVMAVVGAGAPDRCWASAYCRVHRPRRRSGRRRWPRRAP